MIYGYARVSTHSQATDGNSLDAQEKALVAAGAEIIYKDAASGKKMQRPEFDKLLAAVKPGDTIIVTKLDRFARSAAQASELIDRLINNNIILHVQNIGLLDNSAAGKLLRNVFLAFAEFERDMIVERTQEGKAIARQQPGYREGRPKKYTKKQIDHAIELLECNSYKQVEEMTGISKSTLIRAKRERGLIWWMKKKPDERD